MAPTLGCIVLAHRSPRQLAWFLASLAHPRVRTWLHLDARVAAAPFKEALRSEGVEGVTLLPRRATRWGGVEVVDATLDGMRAARAAGCGHVLLLSGQDGLVWPLDRLLDFFDASGDRSYLESFPLPDPRWRLDGRVRTDFYTYTVLGKRETYVPRREGLPMSARGRILNALLGLRTAFRPTRRFPACARPHGGSQWWNLSAAAADHVLSFLDRHPEYRAYHEHTLIPDEIFVQSIVAGTSFAADHPVENRSLRYVRWREGASHPDVLTAADVPALKAADQPFARKFDADVDPAALTALRGERG